MSAFNNVAMSSRIKTLHAQMMVWFADGKGIADADIKSKYENEKRATILDCVAPGKGETADMEYVVATLGATPRAVMVRVCGTDAAAGGEVMVTSSPSQSRIIG